MTERTISLQDYLWSVRCFIGYEPSDAPYICRALESIGCGDRAIHEAYEHLSHGSNDRGLTYSNLSSAQSIVAVGRSHTKAGTINTIGHELLHVVSHICERYHIDMHTEEPCYIMGSLCEALFEAR